MLNTRPAAVEGPSTQFPTADFPVIFTDGPWSLVNSAHIVKMYFARLDASFAGDGNNRANPVVQLVMPIDAFVRMFAFVEAQMKTLQTAGVITDSDIAEARAIFTPK